jgi:phosphoglycolate phosphatase-like HAD superfamily hydrolase
MKKLLALDFDGVLWDSVGECFVIACRVYQELYALPCTDLEGPFRRGRWLARTGGDFLLLLQLALADPQVDLAEYEVAQFEELRHRRATECQEFARHFYAERERSRLQQWKQWCSYQQSYPQFLEQLGRLEGVFAGTVVCTTKDEASVHSLLATVNLQLPVYGRESTVDKGAQLKKVCADFGVGLSDVFFIDDLVENLEQVAPGGTHCGLAAWGYNTKAERERALALGFAVLPVYEVAQFLKEWAAR